MLEKLNAPSIRPAASADLYDWDELVQEDRVHRLIYTDQAIFEAELTNIWGAVRVMPADRAALIAEHKARLTADSLASADLSNGRAVFEKTCATCHRLFDSGGAVGPELTG